MRLRFVSLTERLRASLFFVPMLAVAAAVVAGALTLVLDSRLDQSGTLPLGLTSTVESARALLSTIASATITFAGIAFSVSLLVIQQASNQYSPRIVHTLFRDRFNKRVMGLVVGTFTYCLVVLRSVRSGVGDSGQPVIPNLSVAVAVLLGLLAILGVVAFINHSAHSMDVSEILDAALDDAREVVHREWRRTDEDAGAIVAPPYREAWEVRFERSGWVQQVNVDALLSCVPAGATMELKVHPGRYAVRHARLCSLSVIPPDAERVAASIRRSVSLGNSRTVQQDPSYGLREITDVALRALSPGINDPTTAQDAIFHATALLLELLERDPPAPVRCGPDGRRIVLAQQPTHSELIDLTFDEVRRAAAPHPTVCVYLLESLALLGEALQGALAGVLAAKADLVVEGCEAAGVVPADLAAVRRAHASRFGAD